MGNKTHKPKVIIGIGCQETVKAKTAHSIACAIIGSKKAEVIDCVIRQGGDIVSARTWLLQYAVEKKADYVLFVDSDMQFPPDTIDKLLAGDKDIMGVEYHKRKLPLEQIATPLDTAIPDGIYPCKAVGTGVMLVKLSILEKLPQPWFNFGRNDKGEIVIGEDIWFCNTAWDNGFQVWCDPTIKTNHIGDYAY